MTVDSAVVKKMHEGRNAANVFQKHQPHFNMNWSKPHKEINISILQMFPVNNLYVFLQERTVIIYKMLFYVIVLKWQKNSKEVSGKAVSRVHLA